MRPPALEAGPEFDGGNAWTHMAVLVCDVDREPPRERVRVPATQGRDEAAAYLHQRLTESGWTTVFQNFTGAHYEALEKGSLARFTGGACDPADRQRLLDLSFTNVVARRGQGDGVLVLMAHYDAKLEANQDADAGNRTLPVPGANDGASGVGLLVEAARVLALGDLHREVRILLVDGEDGFEDCHPDAGSLYYARGLSAIERERIEGVLLLDMVGDLGAHFCIAGQAPGLEDALRQAARQAGESLVADAPRCSLFDDHTPFVDLGIPAIDLVDYQRPGTPHGFPPYWHTRQDTPDKVSPLMLERVGRVVVNTVRALAASPA